MKEVIILLFVIINYSIVVKCQDTSNIEQEIINYLVAENELDTTTGIPLGFASYEIVYHSEISEVVKKVGIYRLSTWNSHSWSYIILKNENNLEFLTLDDNLDNDFIRVIHFIKKNKLYNEEQRLNCLKTLIRDYMENQRFGW